LALILLRCELFLAAIATLLAATTFTAALAAAAGAARFAALVREDRTQPAVEIAVAAIAALAAAALLAASAGFLTAVTRLLAAVAALLAAAALLHDAAQQPVGLRGAGDQEHGNGQCGRENLLALHWGDLNPVRLSLDLDYRSY
jgi:hypothetical protein